MVRSYNRQHNERHHQWCCWILEGNAKGIPAHCDVGLLRFDNPNVPGVLDSIHDRTFNNGILWRSTSRYENRVLHQEHKMGKTGPAIPWSLVDRQRGLQADVKIQVSQRNGPRRRSELNTRYTILFNFLVDCYTKTYMFYARLYICTKLKMIKSDNV